MKETLLSWMKAGDTILVPLLQTAMVVCALSLILTVPQKTRRWSGWIFVVTAWLIGLKAWLMGAQITLLLWGWIGLLVGSLLFGFGVVPTAIVATLMSGERDLTIITALCITVAIGFAGRWLGLLLIASGTPKGS